MTWVQTDAEAEGRYRALEALPAGSGARAPLLAALGDESWRVRRLAVERLVKLEPSAALVTELVQLLGRRGEAGLRNAAASVLSQLGPAAAPPVIALLAHEDPHQRKFAADILGELRRPEATEALVKALADGDQNVRAAAAEALGHLGGAGAERALFGLLDAPDPMLRICALEGLAEQRAPPPLPRLVALLNDPWTRTSAFRVLGLVEHPTAFALVCRALGAAATRDSALVALGVRGRPPSPEVEDDLRAVLRATKDLLPWLTHALESDAPERRLGALLAAHALGEATTVGAVARAVRPGLSSELALTVLVRLGVRGARLLLSSTRTLLELPSPSRAVVAEALVQLAEPSLVSALINLLRAGDQELAELALRALGRTRARAAIAPLLGAFDDERLGPVAFRSLLLLAESWPAEVREALTPRAMGAPTPWVVRAWADLVQEEALEAVQRASKDADEALRAAAAEAAPSLNEHAAALVRSALLDESALVRRAAARSLKLLRHDEGRGLVAGALSDPDPAVLSLAAQAAAQLAALDAAPRLLELTAHAQVGVALAALDALSLLGAVTDEVLQRVASHPDPEALKRVLALGADRAALVPLAVGALSHARWDVRVAAGRALAVAGGEAEVALVRGAAGRETDPVARESLEQLVSTLAAP